MGNTRSETTLVFLRYVELSSEAGSRKNRLNQATEVATHRICNPRKPLLVVHTWLQARGIVSTSLPFHLFLF